MPLSANTLIHFTNTKDNLKQILKENFRLFFCKELVTLGTLEMQFLSPMVSFCDIPLSEIKDHIEKYGSYGIGLTKEWGVKNGMNPVLYLSQNSILSEAIIKTLKHFCNVPRIKDLTKEQKDLAEVLRYIKNYEGVLARNGSTNNKYRFSDEREWRYVPSNDNGFDMLINCIGDIDPQHRKTIDDALIDLRLEFEPNDIKYIIIKDETEIGEFINLLKEVKGNKYSYHDVERLTTRLLTVEQIKGDI